ncbi:MAG: HIT domain-containing protein [Nanoarchaeota archaeon]|nr:HIT domain-containing protein [Nanoarchaeota archaeon]MBU1005697.1 HIT domain-containing protein [Nanoarchaeota archaeon]MBU1946412.1 HIT domain-containing protein [Nanoarchaeota archaeon]
MAEQCIICQIISGEVPSKKIYEDDDILAILDFNGASPGHTFVMPKEHFPIFEQMPSHLVGKLFNVANKVSSAIFETLKVQGTNIFVTNGVPAGQRVAHFMINVIPRMENDGINMQWKTRQLSEEEMSTIELKLKEEISKVGVGEAPKLSSTPKKIETISDDTEGEESCLVRQLRRIP